MDRSCDGRSVIYDGESFKRKHTAAVRVINAAVLSDSTDLACTFPQVNNGRLWFTWIAAGDCDASQNPCQASILKRLCLAG